MSIYSKFLVLLFVILYCISPIDACPGPVDDILIAVMAYAVTSRKSLIKG